MCLPETIFWTLDACVRVFARVCVMFSQSVPVLIVDKHFLSTTRDICEYNLKSHCVFTSYVILTHFLFYGF